MDNYNHNIDGFEIVRVGSIGGLIFNYLVTPNTYQFSTQTKKISVDMYYLIEEHLLKHFMTMILQK
jgi:hypothetical protein